MSTCAPGSLCVYAWACWAPSLRQHQMAPLCATVRACVRARFNYFFVPPAGSAAQKLHIEPDGRLVLSSAEGTEVWSAGPNDPAAKPPFKWCELRLGIYCILTTSLSISVLCSASVLVSLMCWFREPLYVCDGCVVYMSSGLYLVWLLSTDTVSYGPHCFQFSLNFC